MPGKTGTVYQEQYLCKMYNVPVAVSMVTGEAYQEQGQHSVEHIWTMWTKLLWTVGY